MFKRLALFVLLTSSISSFAMVYDEDNDGAFYLMGTLTCPGERMVRRIKGTHGCTPLKYDDTEIEHRRHTAQEKKDQRSCSILAALHEFIAQHKYSMPATPFTFGL